MKENFVIDTIDESTDLNKISLTGARAIVLLGLLIQKPMSLEEIKKAFVEYNLIGEKHSEDIIRIDMNTLKHIGCEISRASKKTNHKFILKKHPFALEIEDKDIKALKKIYNLIKLKSDISVLIRYHKLFSKIAEHIIDVETREAFLGISVLKQYDINMLQELLTDCSQERYLIIAYKSPTGTKETQKTVAAQKLVLKNDKLYLYCCDADTNSPLILNLKRIRAILARKLQKGGIQSKKTVVKFFLTDFGYDSITDEETILKAGNDGYTILGEYHNQFIAVQRILSFGAKCTVLEPEEFKKVIIDKLKEMRKMYE